MVGVEHLWRDGGETGNVCTSFASQRDSAGGTRTSETCAASSVVQGGRPAGAHEHERCTAHRELRAGRGPEVETKGVLSSLPVCAEVDERKYSHLRPIFDNLPNTISEDERSRVVSLVNDFHDVFSTSEYDVGKTSLIEATITMTNMEPRAEAVRRHAKIYESAIV